MNKTDQQKNNKYINYWTKVGLSAKKEHQDTKIEITYTYTDSKGILRSRTTKRHPILKEISFETKPVIKSDIDKETYRKLYLENKKQKEEKLANIPFSNYHNKLLNNSYSKPKNVIKQQFIKAAHNAEIDKIIFNKRQQKLFCKTKSKEDCPNLVIVNMLDSNKLPYCFSITPSRLSLYELFNIAKSINTMQSKCVNYFSTEIWEKSEYTRYMKIGKGNYRYCVYREKEQTKNAA